uniref:Adenosine receptor A3 n=1 Tax=Leptobrachium leishanense TaxID=445787 RepID=A0A8C5LRT2_9ANUR
TTPEIIAFQMYKFGTGMLMNIYIGMESMIGLFAFFGNVLVIWAVKLNPALQDTTFYFIVSLALADLAVGILVMPLAIILHLEITCHFHLCLLMCCLIIIMTNASILSLLAIAVDRYMRIKVPVRYRTLITKQRIYVCILFSWSLSILAALVPMFGWNNRSNLEEERNYLECKFSSVMSLDFLVYFCFFGWVVVPLIVMVALYTELLYLVRKQITLNKNNFQARQAFYNKEYKTARSLAFVVGLFALCWLPISIINCINYFHPSVLQSKAFQPALLLSIVLSHLNSAMNPFVYAFKIKKFKRTFIQSDRYHCDQKCISKKQSYPLIARDISG